MNHLAQLGAFRWKCISFLTFCYFGFKYIECKNFPKITFEMFLLSNYSQPNGIPLNSVVIWITLRDANVSIDQAWWDRFFDEKILDTGCLNKILKSWLAFFFAISNLQLLLCLTQKLQTKAKDDSPEATVDTPKASWPHDLILHFVVDLLTYSNLVEGEE